MVPSAPRTSRRAARVAALGAALLAMTAAACSSGSDGASTTTTSTATTTMTAAMTTSTTGGSSTTSAATTTSSTSAPPTTAIADECTSDALTVRLDSSGVAAGTAYYAIVYTNRSASRCVMQGYAGVSFVDANGREIGIAAARATGEHPVSPVPLAPGADAHSNLLLSQTGFVGTPQCGPTVMATSLRIYVPDSTTAIDLPWPAEVCTGDVTMLRVEPVTPGAQVEGSQ